MRFIPTELAGVVVIEPTVFEDERGFFMETFHRAKFAEQGIDVEFVQDNHSKSVQRTLRGLHCQMPQAQGKLVRAVRGEVFDVAVDLRRSSPTFGRWVGYTLSEANRRQVYIPPEFAHGFCVVSDEAEIIYKCTRLYCRADERTIIWNDPDLAINWPISDPILSDKDKLGVPFREAATFE